MQLAKIFLDKFQFKTNMSAYIGIEKTDDLAYRKLAARSQNRSMNATEKDKYESK